MSKKVGSRKRLNSTSTDFDSLLPKWPCVEPYSLTDPLGLEKVKKDVEGSEKRNKTNESGRPKRRRNSSFSHGSKRVKSKSAEKSRNTDDEEAAKHSTSSSSKKYKRRKSQSAEKRSAQNVSSLLESRPTLDRFQYGNYKNINTAVSIDIIEQRMKIFRRFRRLFESRSVLDVGCGTGDLLRALSSLGCSRLLGVDRDSSLIRSANNASQKFLKQNSSVNLSFKVHNFVPPSSYDASKYYPPTLLDSQAAEYDCVMMLSVCKWIHLTYGDSGIKTCFNKVHRLLKRGGAFILEPQMWPSYKESRKINDAMFRNFNSIELFPNKFPKFLIDSCQFSSYHLIGDIEKRKKKWKGKKEEKTKTPATTTYKRPVFVFYKL